MRSKFWRRGPPGEQDSVLKAAEMKENNTPRPRFAGYGGHGKMAALFSRSGRGVESASPRCDRAPTGRLDGPTPFSVALLRVPTAGAKQNCVGRGVYRVQPV